MDVVGRRLKLQIAALGILSMAPGILLGQVTHGQKPQLPAPFATKSAGNPPEEAKPPKLSENLNVDMCWKTATLVGYAPRFLP